MARRKEETAAAVIYARYSSHNQKEESIEQQVEECTAFAESSGIKVIKVYADKAISGRTDKRTQFQRMMRDAEKGLFRTVIAYKSNRIARNMLQALTYEAKLDGMGIKTLYAKEEFGNSAAGRFALRTMMNVNQFYSENMAEDIRRGMEDNAANCKVNGPLPLGYRKGEDGKFAVNPREAAVVKEVYDRFYAGSSLVDIANSLNARGIKTKHGSQWNKGSFHRLLTNDCYIGVYRHSGIVVNDGVPPIIDKEVFYSVQDRLASKKTPQGRTRNDSDYLLTGKLFCGYCGSYMTGVSGISHTGNKHHYYACVNRKTGKGCKKKHVRREWIESLVAELTKKIILQDDVIEWIAANAVDYQEKARRDSDIALMEAELAENQKAVKNIITAIEQGIFTASTKDRLLELELDISTQKRAILLAQAANKPIEKERIIFALEQFRDGDVCDPKYRQRLITAFVKKIYLWDDRIKISYYYAGKKNSITYTFPDEADGASGGEVRLSSPTVHHRRTIRTLDGLQATVCLAGDEFVLFCDLY